jgi:hypothetical protein
MAINKLINGFSELMGRGNLCANPNFLINQRALFTSATACNINDWVADMWYLEGSDIDYLEATNFSSGGIKLSGHGKKNQSLTIRNKEAYYISSPFYSAFGEHIMNSSSTRIPFTACCDFACNKGIVFAGVNTPYKSSYNTSIYSKNVTLKSGQYGRGIDVKETTVWNINYPQDIEIYLKADGDFEIDCYNFQLLCGAFRNPPLNSYVHPADDLSRCEGYYQRWGDWRININNSLYHPMAPIHSSTNYLFTSWFMPFKRKMVAAPTMTITNSATYFYYHVAGATGADASVAWATFVSNANADIMAYVGNSSYDNFLVQLRWDKTYYTTGCTAGMDRMPLITAEVL